MTTTTDDPAWRTSSFSQVNETACVEVAPSTGTTTFAWLVRDTKHRAGGTLTLPAATFARLRGFAQRP